MSRDMDNTHRPIPTAMHTRAVEHYQQTGTILPGSQGEIAAYLAAKNGEQDG